MKSDFKAHVSSDSCVKRTDVYYAFNDTKVGGRKHNPLCVDFPPSADGGQVTINIKKDILPLLKRWGYKI